MTALYCSRHQTGWTSPPALCPVCHDARESGGKVAHHDMTVQEAADNHGFPDDTPRVNYAKTCGTSALAVEAHKLERELRAAVDGLSEESSRAERAKAEMRLVAEGLEAGVEYATKLGEKYTNDHAVGYLQSVIGSWLPRLRGELPEPPK